MTLETSIPLMLNLSIGKDYMNRHRVQKGKQVYRDAYPIGNYELDKSEEHYPLAKMSA